jgi:hypothetical protein
MTPVSCAEGIAVRNFLASSPYPVCKAISHLHAAPLIASIRLTTSLLP